jgi:predicted O-methyltransferase YrrM
MSDATLTIGAHPSDDIIYGRQALNLGEPWIVQESIAFIRAVMQPTWSVFEWGTGGSTIFWLRNCAELVTVEHHPDWVKRVQDMIIAAKLPPKLTNVINYVSRDPGDGGGPQGFTFHNYADAILPFPEASFDLVSVDGEASCRGWCITNALPRIKPGGWLLLDNSDWYTVTMGWPRWDFVAKGLHWVGQPGTFDWWTSVFRKPE